MRVLPELFRPHRPYILYTLRQFIFFLSPSISLYVVLLPFRFSIVSPSENIEIRSHTHEIVYYCKNAVIGFHLFCCFFYFFIRTLLHNGCCCFFPISSSYSHSTYWLYTTTDGIVDYQTPINDSEYFAQQNCTELGFRMCFISIYSARIGVLYDCPIVLKFQ